MTLRCLAVLLLVVAFAGAPEAGAIDAPECRVDVVFLHSETLNETVVETFACLTGEGFTHT